MDSPLFSFGIITDTHVRAPEGDLSSPYAVNERANARAAYAASLLAAQKPAFTVHLGDMVHPIPGMSSYDPACSEALRLLSPLQPDLHFVPGNHDVGDKPMSGSPAANVDQVSIKAYASHFGKDWYSFEHNSVYVIVLNSSLVNTQSSLENEQLLWLQGLLKSTSCQRYIMFSHYPLYLHDTEEAEHYDNLAEPGRSKLLELVKRHKVEMVFSGHVHHFFYNRLEDTSLYVLPPTSFTRQDYAELFRGQPAAQFGRDDTGKYSVAMVDVFATGHKLRLIPTQGMESDAEESHLVLNKAVRPSKKQMTVSLRHAWHESIDLPYNGPMEEFSRKRVRNDYTLLRLLQMGIDDVRVPVHDLIEQNSRTRMLDYASQGIRFHLVARLADIQSHQLLLNEHARIISRIECVLPEQEYPLSRLPLIQPVSNIPVIIGCAMTGAHSLNDKKPFAHTVTAGFEWSSRNRVLVELDKRSDQLGDKHPATGVLFQIPWELDCLSTIEHMRSTFSARLDQCHVNLRLAPGNPAESNFDDKLIHKRVSDALEAVTNSPNIFLHLDTFSDMDRGYSPRHGLVDRLYNCRKSGDALRN